MILFEAMNGKKCDTPVSCDNLTDRPITGLDLLKKMEERMIKISFMKDESRFGLL
jgi:hypothetical protein